MSVLDRALDHDFQRPAKRRDYYLALRSKRQAWRGVFAVHRCLRAITEIVRENPSFSLRFLSLPFVLRGGLKSSLMRDHGLVIKAMLIIPGLVSEHAMEIRETIAEKWRVPVANGRARESAQRASERIRADGGLAQFLRMKRDPKINKSSSARERARCT